MNQKCSSILLILAILSGVITTSYASQRRVPDSLFQLTFKNGFAVCDVTCTADYSTDKVVVNVTLYKGWDVVGAWTDQGKGNASITEQVKAVKGAEYTMSITWSVAGQWQRSETIRKTYTG